MTITLPTHEDVRAYVEARGLVPTCMPGVYRERCMSCSHELHGVAPGPVFHAARVLGPSRDASGRYCDPVGWWRVAREALEKGAA